MRVLNLATVAALGLLAIGCSGTGPVGPSADVAQASRRASDVVDLSGVRALDNVHADGGPTDVYVTWSSGRGLTDMPDDVALDALAKLEAAAGGLLVIHRQQVGEPQIRLLIDDAVGAKYDGARGVALQTGPCAGDAVVESSATADSFILLHELGHLFISHTHSPYAEDVLAPGGTFRPGPRPTTFTGGEVALLRSSIAAGCTRVDTWPAR